MSTLQSTSPPICNTSTSYDSNDKIIYRDSATPSLPHRPRTFQVIRSVVSDEGLPEVVDSHRTREWSNHHDAPIPVDTLTSQHDHNAPIPVSTLTSQHYHDAPIPVDTPTGQNHHDAPIPVDTPTGQHYHDALIPASTPDPPLPPRQSNCGSVVSSPPPSYNSSAPHPPTQYSSEAVQYVTPLQQLGDLPKFVDCPFCRRRAETRVKKSASKMTHVSAAVLGFGTIVGGVAPYAGKWHSHTSHYCTNCEHKVAIRRWGSKKMKALGAPDDIRQVSQFPPATSPSLYDKPLMLLLVVAYCLGNLPYEVKPSEVEEVLATNGFDSLDKIHISVDPVSARNPGYCFVDFHDRETAERALSSLNAAIYGRTLKVGPCEPKKPRDRRGFRDEGATSRRWGDWNARAPDDGNPTGQANSKGEARGPNWALDHFEDVVEHQGGRRLYVGGLDKMIDQAQHQEEISEIFSGFKPYVNTNTSLRGHAYSARTAIGKRITPHESKRIQPGNHHYCFVDFETKEEASSAVEALNGKDIPGGRLKVSVSERTPSKLGGRLLDSRDGRRAQDGGFTRNNNSRPSNKPETNNAMASNNWRRKD
ncbi:hypothetical protein F66182_7865 [Fusarium sp. NRRL 66182]|nr:hypothetical protein F66182_7865 [Fusarium sp. NRRL 66182]